MAVESGFCCTTNMVLHKHVVVAIQVLRNAMGDGCQLSQKKRYKGVPGFLQKSDNKIPCLSMTITPFSMMPGRQTQKKIARIHHLHKRKVKYLLN